MAKSRTGHAISYPKVISSSPSFDGENYCNQFVDGKLESYIWSIYSDYPQKIYKAYCLNFDEKISYQRVMLPKIGNNCIFYLQNGCIDAEKLQKLTIYAYNSSNNECKNTYVIDKGFIKNANKSLYLCLVTGENDKVIETEKFVIIYNSNYPMKELSSVISNSQNKDIFRGKTIKHLGYEFMHSKAFLVSKGNNFLINYGYNNESAQENAK